VTIGSKDTLAAAVAFFVAVAVIITVPVYGLRRALKYSLASSALEIRLFGLIVCRVRLSDIDGVEVVPFAALIPISPSFRRDLFFAQRWNAYRNRIIAIKRRSGLIRGITISPEDPEQFSNLVREAVLKCAGRQVL